ncbi:MAG: DeoR/GlpR family DNA-binding transcription regulator [Opitutaceae bacterium]|nr:DeoR/GlpR family DNA-binding transcription regulator [Opitutaceae bacterium]
MFAEERHRAIESIVRQKGRLTVGELAVHLGASDITVRRDLRRLEAAGKVLRTHGGALHPEFRDTEPGFERKAVDAVAAKIAIARAVAMELPARGHVFLDAGTTCLEVARQILDRRELTVVTNSIPVLQLGTGAKARVVAVGGEVRAVSLALVGGLALEWLGGLRFDVAVISASGLDAREGASTTELSEAAVKRAACARARKCILVSHAAKWNHPAAVGFGGWDSFQLFVTDAKLTAAEKAVLRRSGVAVNTVSHP